MIENICQNFGTVMRSIIDSFLSCNYVMLHPDTYGVRSIDVTDTSEDTVHIMCLFNTFSTESGCTVSTNINY